MDNLGFGLSDRPRDFDYTPESHARVLRAFVDRLGLRDVTLVVHDYGGPIGLPLALEQPTIVRRLVLLNTWMWSFDDDPDMVRKGKIAGGRLGRLLYRYANFSLRVITPSAYADKRKLTPQIHEQYLAPFRDIDSRGRVLWALARAILGSSQYYDSLWRQRERLRDMPALIVWGTKDPAFQLPQLARWRDVLPEATVVELPVGHWPQEEAPNEVRRAIEAFLR
jgi:haloalkane dehalogenase